MKTILIGVMLIGSAQHHVQLNHDYKTEKLCKLAERSFIESAGQIKHAVVGGLDLMWLDCISPEHLKKVQEEGFLNENDIEKFD